EPFRGQDVGLFAVLVLEQGNPSRAVGVVLDGEHLGPHAVLLALEVDDAIALLVPAAAEPAADDALVVPAARLRLGTKQRLLGLVGLGIGAVGEIADRSLAPPRGRRLVCADAHIILASPLSPEGRGEVVIKRTRSYL